ncbi:MAG: hypothetical protein NZ826_06475, partial [Thermodesulfovibrio sp.]|nr:hypothetical protein [Thermodesulfovibrio sp.]
EIEIIPWTSEFAIADHNPEIINSIQNLEKLLAQGKISKEKFNQEIEKLKGYSSKTLAIAFNKLKKVSFREMPPSPLIAIHELGHVYFQVNDLLWNAIYGGGEILLWLALKNRFHVTEKNIKFYLNLLKNVYLNPEQVHKFITRKIANKIKVYPHLLPICLFAGFIPSISSLEVLTLDLSSEEWKNVPVNDSHLFEFFQNLVSGLQYNDVIWINYAKWLGLIDK